MIIVSDGVYSLKTPYSGTCKTIVYVSGVLGTAVLSVGYYDDFDNVIPIVNGLITVSDTQYIVENGLGVDPVLSVSGSDGSTNISVLVASSDT